MQVFDRAVPKDGHHTLRDIAERSGLAFSKLCEVAEILLAANLIMEAPV